MMKKTSLAGITVALLVTATVTFAQSQTQSAAGAPASASTTNATPPTAGQTPAASQAPATAQSPNAEKMPGVTPAASAPAAAAGAVQPTAQGDAKAGRDKAAMCIGCHGIPYYKTAFPTVYQVPRIGGQNPGYIVNALRGYATGQRMHPSMQAVAKSLKDQDMLDLAAYYSSLGAKK